MEAAGLAVGVVGLAALLDSCVKGFKHIQKGRELNKDYLILATKFGNQELRLKTWGKASGLFEDPPNDARLHDAELRTQLENTLTCIKTLLDDADTLKSKYGLRDAAIVSAVNQAMSVERASAVDPVSAVNWVIGINGAPNDTLTLRSPPSRSLGRLFQRLKSKKRASHRVTEKMTWAIVDHDRFSALIMHLKDFIDDLETLTRTTDVPQRQRHFVEVEIQSMYDLEELQVIEEAREGVDDIVSDAASARIELLSGGSRTIISDTDFATTKSHFSNIGDIIEPGLNDLEDERSDLDTANLGLPIYTCVMVGGAAARREVLRIASSVNQEEESECFYNSERSVRIQRAVDDRTILLNLISEAWPEESTEDHTWWVNSPSLSSSLKIFMICVEMGSQIECDLVKARRVSRLATFVAIWVIVGVEERDHTPTSDQERYKRELAGLRKELNARHWLHCGMREELKNVFCEVR